MRQTWRMFPGRQPPACARPKVGRFPSPHRRAARYYRRTNTRQAVCHTEDTMKCVEFQDVKKETVSRWCQLEDPRTINSHCGDVASTDGARWTLGAVREE